MKTVRLFLFLVAFMGVAITANAQKANKTVVYNADIHCDNCKAKIEKNIPYEKGVKDLKVDIDKKTVTVTFREDKNTAEEIKAAIEKLNISVSDFKETTADSKEKETKKAKKE